ncbi:MAG: hypothetical protein HN849_11175 [Victivallales bacterium]|jgi:hypothetical protein|nr:hypothetical protein [Victivallales bacterium]MBT7300069.1 hypothetical protein [Victivallales bacterium]
MSLEDLAQLPVKQFATLFVVLAGVSMLSLWVAGDSKKPILLWKNALISVVAACLCVIPYAGVFLALGAVVFMLYYLAEQDDWDTCFRIAAVASVFARLVAIGILSYLARG